MAGWRARAGGVVALLTALAAGAPAAAAENPPFSYERLMVPMRDGARMETVVLRPKGARGPLPILLSRTPYGVPGAAPATVPASLAALHADGYIFVQQSMRGRFGSDGRFAASTDLAAPVNEATDAWDAIDWLIKNLPGHNGRVGLWGVSYPGLAAAIALADPHPALKAVSPQAAWADWWLHDDLHRQGALRLSYATDWLYGLQAVKTDNAPFPYYDRDDLYDWFLALGPVENLETRYLNGRVPAFTALLDHPDYDAHWRAERWIDRLAAARVPTLHVAGFWDQEDPWGSWEIYRTLERADPDGINMIVAGPWNHGSWRGRGEAVGPVPIGRDTGPEYRRDIEAPFFRHWLHREGPRPRFEARILQSGSWAWRDYPHWPPKAARPTALYLHADGLLSFDPPGARGPGTRGYVSDPAAPVPYRPRPIGPTYPCGDWCWWEAMDQRFLAGRADVLSYVSAPLEADLTVTGEVLARLHASTSGTDADFVVKLIDIYPEGGALGGYQWPIAMDVRRGRWLDGNEQARPLVPDAPREWRIDLRARDHVFKKGHRIMVQVQSSWFPVIDRNPQSFVANIARARPEDFRPATQLIWSTPDHPSHIVLPVMR